MSLDESSLDSWVFESSSSSSTSESEEDIPVNKAARIENYLDVIRSYTDLQFKQHFRLTRIVAGRLIDDYTTFSRRAEHAGRKALNPDAQVYITLWFMANTETHRQMSDRFDVARSTVYLTLYRVINWIVAESPKYIKWPTALEMEDNKRKFRMKKGLPDVIGAIDGSHIKINTPTNHKSAYLNRKKYYSVLLQGIVNAEKKFIDIHCGEPGAMHDARLFRKSGFYKHLMEDQSLIVPGGVLLGDSAYPESAFMVPPFKDYGNLSEKQLKFNYLHSSTRIVVENAFGLLKTRFRRLKFFESPNIGFISKCIVTACVLHNICISEDDFIDIEYLDDEVDNNILDITDSQPMVNNGAREKMFRAMDANGLLN